MSSRSYNIPGIPAYYTTALITATTLFTAYYGGRKLLSFNDTRKKVSEEVVFDEHQHGGLLVARVLKKHGVNFLFTLSGGHISPILVGSKELGIRVVDVRHEVTAVFAADAVSRVTGVPGVACVTAGPGLTNTVTAVKNAQMAQSALILLGGATSGLLKGMGSLQDIDQKALLEPHVKWMASVTCVADIVPTLEKAFYIAQSGTPGPVFIELPVDILYPENVARKWFEKETTFKGSILSLRDLKRRIQCLYVSRYVDNIFSISGKKIPIHEPLALNYHQATTTQVQQVMRELEKARKPVLVVGSQTAILPAGNVNQTGLTLQQAILALNIPTYTSGSARGLLGRDSSNGFKHNRTYALRNADLVIMTGVVCDFRMDYGRCIGHQAKYISVNRDRDDLFKNKTPDVAIQADPATFLHKLANIKNPNIQWGPWTDELRAKEQERDASINQQASTPITPMNPLKVCQVIEEVMGEDSVIVVDGGDFVGSASYVVRPRQPLTWLDPGAFGTLGVGGGFALGAQLCRPTSEVWVIFGDGACGYSLSEFDTYVRHKIPVIAVVGNDAAWQQILRGQVDVFHDDVGCTLAFTDYHQVVIGFGAEGLFVNKESDLLPTLKRAQELAHQGKPVLVNCQIGKTDFRKDSIAI